MQASISSGLNSAGSWSVGLVSFMRIVYQTGTRGAEAARTSVRTMILLIAGALFRSGEQVRLDRADGLWPTRQHRPFEVQQRRLARQAAAVACQLAVRADDPVAGNDDRNRVAAVRQPDGASGARQLDPARDLAVGDGLAEADGLQLSPDAPLERSAAGRQRQVEARERAGEVGIELASRLRERLPIRALDPIGADGRAAFVRVHVDAGYGGAVRGDQQRPDRALDKAVEGAHFLSSSDLHRCMVA